jgi:hypothetical protein
MEIIINNKPYTIPEGWHKLDLEVAVKLLTTPTTDLLFELSGIPDIIAEQLPESYQAKISDILQKFTEPLPEFIEPINIAALPFARYCTMQEAIGRQDLTSFVCGYLGLKEGMASDLLPCYIKLLPAWNKWLEGFKTDAPDISGLKQLGERFGIYTWIYELSGGNILNEAKVLELPTGQVFRHWQYSDEKGKFERNLLKDGPSNL